MTASSSKVGSIDPLLWCKMQSSQHHLPARGSALLQIKLPTNLDDVCWYSSRSWSTSVFLYIAAVDFVQQFVQTSSAIKTWYAELPVAFIDSKIQITTSAFCHSIFMGWMLFLTPNQQCQSTEGKKSLTAHTHAHTHTHTHSHNHFTALLDFVWEYSAGQKGKTRKVKPIWIYWSKR